MVNVSRLDNDAGPPSTDQAFNLDGDTCDRSVEPSLDDRVARLTWTISEFANDHRKQTGAQPGEYISAVGYHHSTSVRIVQYK